MQRIFRAGDHVRFGFVARDPAGDVIDISGATVLLRFKIGAGAAVERAGTITAGPLGRGEYRTGDADLAVESGKEESEIWWEWQLTLGGHPAHGPPQRSYGKVIKKLA